MISGPAPARPAITGIAFVAFRVGNEASAEHFYNKELGLRPIAGASGNTLYPVNRQQWIETRPNGAEAHVGREAAFGLVTSDINAMGRYLAGKGYLSTQGVMSNGVCEPVSQNQQLTVHDPEGNTVVFVQSGSASQLAQSPPTPNAISRRIIHAGFVVKSEAAENAFYHDVLGFKPYWHGGMRDGVTDWASQQVPNGTDWIEYMLNIKPDASPNTLGVMNHVSLGVEKMDSAVAQLATNGCDTAECKASKMGRDGKIQLNLYDPDHTRIEVMEFAPTGPVCCSPYSGSMPSSGDPQ
ncbi:MAG: VOC family protein [Janthinobacterium lividum]